MERDVELLARAADLGEPWHLPRGRDEARVSSPAPAAAGEHEARGRVRQIGDQRAVVGQHLRPDRHAQLRVGTAGTVLPGAAPVAAADCTQQSAPAQRGKVAKRRVRAQHDVATVATVATVGAALRDVLLAAEAEPAVPPAPGLDAKLSPIVEHRANGSDPLVQSMPGGDMSRRPTSVTEL